MQIKTVGVISLGKILGILYAFFGFLAGLVLSLIALMGSII
jgi:hypothetical protein